MSGRTAGRSRWSADSSAPGSSVRAYTDTGLSALLAYGEIALGSIFFLCSLLYLRPYKKSAKMLARQVIKKASESVNE